MFARVTFLQHRKIWAVVIIAGAVFAAYYSALQLGFYGDDWIFYELAGRLSWSEYLVKYFDPRAQTAWYRPVQGIVFRLAYILFGTNAPAFHWVNVLFHLGNAYWLVAILHRATRNWKLAVSAALLFATLPVAALAVFWPGVVDAQEAFFVLATIWFWLGYLQTLRRRDYIFAFVAFLLALFSKEIGITLPVILFLIDRCVVAQSASPKQLVRRYIGFVFAWLAYMPLELVVLARSVFIQREGYSPAQNILTNLVDYLSALVLPWFSAPPANLLWLIGVAGALTFLIAVKRQRVWLPIVVGAVLMILPVTPFPFVATRFLYVASVAPAIAYAALIDWLTARWRWSAPVIVGALMIFGAWNISTAAKDFGEWARVARVPFRNVSQAHPTFAPDTRLYFVNAPVPGTNLSGMFFWRYGKNISVGADDLPARADLRAHQQTFVYVFDEQGNQKEIAVDPMQTTRATPAPPVDFGAMRLEDFELVNANLKSNEPLVLILYWRATQKIDTAQTVVVQLIDAGGQWVAAYASEPRAGKSPTPTWVPGELIVDAIQLSVAQVSPGAYRLVISLAGAQDAKQIILESIQVIR